MVYFTKCAITALVIPMIFWYLLFELTRPYSTHSNTPTGFGAMIIVFFLFYLFCLEIFLIKELLYGGF